MATITGPVSGPHHGITVHLGSPNTPIKLPKITNNPPEDSAQAHARLVAQYFFGIMSS